MSSQNPKISFVIAARNDDYGGNFLNRFHASVRALAHLAGKHALAAELVVVEYNPPADKAPLANVVATHQSNNLPIRVITVPPEFHERIGQGKKNPFLEYVAKNIGIRRARGEFILATNPDIVFSDAFIRFLATEPLAEDSYYRANRHDLPAHLFAEEIHPEEILRWCAHHVTRIITNQGSMYVSWRRWFTRYLPTLRPLHILRAPIWNIWVHLKMALDPTRIHVGAAGDFLLAHRNAWTTVRGYDQEPFNSFVDGYHVHMLRCAGLRQHIIGLPLYHIGHKTSNDIRPIMDTRTYYENAARMERTGIPYKIYTENWGFPEEQFPENIRKKSGVR